MRVSFRICFIIMGVALPSVAVWLGASGRLEYMVCLLILARLGGILIMLTSRLSNLQRRSWAVLLIALPIAFVPFAIAFKRVKAKPSAHPTIYQQGMRFFESGEAGLEDLLSQIWQAKTSIYLEFFIISRGRLWQKFFSALMQACLRGVRVEVVYGNRFGSCPITRKHKKTLRSVGATIGASKRGGLEAMLLGYTNHRKLAIIDNIMYVGGVNLADEYANLRCKQNPPKGYFKDSLIKVEYNQQTRQSFFSGTPQNGLVKEMVLSLINSAQSKLVICTPYLVPDKAIEQALISAVARGVNVFVALPSVPDKPLAHRLSLHYANKLKGLGVSTLQYSKGYLHLKAILSDDSLGTRCMLGSVNLDMRSMYQQYECGMLVRSNQVEKCVNEVLQLCEDTKKRRTLLLPLLLLVAPLI